MLNRLIHVSMLALIGSVALAAEAQVQRTPWGTPEFSGVWSNASLTQLTRDRGVDKLVVTEDEAQEIIAARAAFAPTRRGTRRSIPTPRLVRPRRVMMISGSRAMTASGWRPATPSRA